MFSSIIQMEFHMYKYTRLKRVEFYIYKSKRYTRTKEKFAI